MFPLGLLWIGEELVLHTFVREKPWNQKGSRLQFGQVRLKEIEIVLSRIL